MEHEPNSNLSNAQGIRLCSDGLEVLLPTDTEFIERQQSYWSLGAQLSPACIVRPRTTQDVATAIRHLAANKCVFAIRSGGHTPWPGASSVSDGVVLDLGLMASTHFNEGDETADIGPGARWKDVYAELDRHGRTVAGGREGHVGVAGLILGGGNTFLTARRGFACDTLVECDVVLADGSVVTADAGGRHRDLFWALKGGSNNFGVVTRFRMQTFPGGKFWGGVTIYPKETSLRAVENLTKFTDDLHRMLDSNLLCFFAYTALLKHLRYSSPDFSQPEIKEVVVGVVTVQVDGDENSPAYEPWRSLPSMLSTCKTTTMSEYVSLPLHSMPTNYHNIFFTATFKNDARIASHAVKLHEKLATDFKTEMPNGDFWTQCLLQPLPTLYGARSAAAGGNATGLERHQEANGLIFVAVAMVRTAPQREWAYPRIRGWVEAVKAFAAATCTVEEGSGGGGGGGLLDWVYLNYADASQNPLGSYGVENLKRLAGVAAKYDPGRVFQELCPGGFKVSRAWQGDVGDATTAS